MLKPKDKKSWSDYPLYAFRTEKVAEIDKAAKRVLGIVNRSVNPKTQKKIKKGELLTEALLLGLKEIERRKS